MSNAWRQVTLGVRTYFALKMLLRNMYVSKINYDPWLRYHTINFSFHAKFSCSEKTVGVAIV